MAKSGGLASTNKKLFRGSSSLELIIEELLEHRRPLTVLEIGRPGGSALTELALAFRHVPVKFCVIGYRPEREYVDGVNLRRLEGNCIDLIYSCKAAGRIVRKAEFIEEVCRVLRPGGVALIQLSKSPWEYPEGPVRDDLFLTPNPSGWVLTHGDDLVPLPMYLRRFARSGFEFDFSGAPGCVLRIAKRREGKLALGLEFDCERSLPIAHLPYTHEAAWRSRSGFRSVYRVSDAGYNTMIQHVLEAALRDVPSGGHPWLPESVPTRKAEPERRTGSLAEYRVGQRVKIKGNRTDGRSFRATKIRPNDDGVGWEELEGHIEWVDVPTGTFGLLGCTVSVDASQRASSTWQLASRGDLMPGGVAKVGGRFRDGRFTPTRLVFKGPQAATFEEIQGPIMAIDVDAASLEVAGFTVQVDTETKLISE